MTPPPSSAASSPPAESASSSGALVTLIDRAVSEGFVSAENRRNILVAETPEALLDGLFAHRPSAGPEWITPDET